MHRTTAEVRFAKTGKTKEYPIMRLKVLAHMRTPEMEASASQQLTDEVTDGIRDMVSEDGDDGNDKDPDFHPVRPIVLTKSRKGMLLRSGKKLKK